MEETLGKRIVFHRKRLGLTQDALAELMGVTAQAVSKWENDQSCPDIGALPKLAEIFGISTDELLGSNGKRFTPPRSSRRTGRKRRTSGNDMGTVSGRRKERRHRPCHLDFTGGRHHADILSSELPREALGRSLAVGASGVRHFRAVSPIFLLPAGLLPVRTVFSDEQSELCPFRLGREFLLPVLLLLFGGSLLVDTLRKSKNGTHNSGCFSFHPTRNGGRKKEHCTCTGNFFDCDTAFGENHYTILLPTLGGGSADVSFGSLSVDLQKCEHLGENCTVDLNCAFGELVLIVPGHFRWSRPRAPRLQAYRFPAHRMTMRQRSSTSTAMPASAKFPSATYSSPRFFHARTSPKTAGSPAGADKAVI